MRPLVARAVSVSRSPASGLPARPSESLSWLRALGLPALGTFLGGIAAFTTLSMADHFCATLGFVGVVTLLSGGAARGAIVRLVRARALRRLVEASESIDGAAALSTRLEGTRVRLRGVARADRPTRRGWLFDEGGLLRTALDFWLVDERGGRTFIDVTNARVLGAGGVRDGDEVEVSGALARRVDRDPGARTTAHAYRDVPLRPVLRADREPLVVVPGTGRKHAVS